MTKINNVPRFLFLHIFVFDQARKLRYNGRIDDTEDPGKTPHSQDARNAINALLNNQEVSVTTTKVFGCSIQSKALQFLQKNQSSSPNYIYTGKDRYKFIEAMDSDWQGALPYSKLMEPGGKVVYSRQGLNNFDSLGHIIFDDPFMGRIYK